MGDIEKDSASQPDPAIEQQIRLEEARKAAAEAEAKREKQQARKAARGKMGKLMKKLPAKAKVGIAAALAILLLFVFGVALPLALNSHETKYLAESDLEEAVNIQSLSTVDYIYHGIAEKEGKFLWADTVDYRVKYEAHIRASYDMSNIRFTIDRESKVVTAYLPEAQIGTPVLDETKFGYLPDRATADIRDVLALCREDAAAEFNAGAMREESAESLKNTIEALTAPLLGSEWTLAFMDLSEYPQEETEDEIA